MLLYHDGVFPHEGMGNILWKFLEKRCAPSTDDFGVSLCRRGGVWRMGGISGDDLDERSDIKGTRLELDRTAETPLEKMKISFLTERYGRRLSENKRSCFTDAGEGFLK